MPDEDDNTITLRILWTTTGMCQPIVSIAIKSEMSDDDRQGILHEVAEHITAGRKKQGDTVEETLGRQCEDHIMVKCNAMHFANPNDKGVIPAPAMVKWLRKTLPATCIIPLSRLKISVAWMKPGTREMHNQP